jgi:hypothetical protein
MSTDPLSWRVWGKCLYASLQLQQAGVEPSLPFSGHSLWRWPPPYHRQRGRLLAVCPDVAELLAIVALHELSLWLVGFNFFCCVAKAGWFKNFMGFLRPGKGYKEQGRACWCGSLWPACDRHLFHAYYVKTEFHQSLVNHLSGRVAWQMSDNSLYGLQGFRVEGKII